MTPGIVLVWLVCGIAAGLIGQSKNRSFGYYFAWGLLFGPFGLLAALLARPYVPPRAPVPVAAPGWLVDPWDPRFLRYWDGGQWVGDPRPR